MTLSKSWMALSHDGQKLYSASVENGYIATSADENSDWEALPLPSMSKATNTGYSHGAGWCALFHDGSNLYGMEKRGYLVVSSDNLNWT
jgi:hypothetical protein